MIGLREPKDIEKNQDFRHVSRFPPPVALSINHESRQQALKQYELAFLFSLKACIEEIMPNADRDTSNNHMITHQRRHPQSGHAARTYFNLEINTAVFGDIAKTSQDDQCHY